MMVNKYIRNGKDEVEIVRGILSADSYFRFCLVLSISFTLLYIVASVLGYGYEKWFGGAKSFIGFSNFGWVLVVQFFGLLFGLFLSYPFYRLIVSRFFPQTFKFTGERKENS